ncbi:MAG: sodium:proton antiporter, partial [Sphingomonas sp.]
SGLLIVGASSFTVALGEALREAGVPVLVVDRSVLALKAARLAGLQTMRIEVLSVLGEETIDLRDYEHLLAATPDDAYNALVCTRFASELGRERVYQIAPDESSGRHAASREWRGKIAVDVDMVHLRLSDLMQGGAAFVVEPVPADADAGQPGWPVAVVSAGGGFTLVSPDDASESMPGDLVVRLYQPALISTPVATRRRFGLPRKRALA